VSYAVALTIEANHDLARLPVAVANYVRRQLLALAEHPVALSEPSHFPYREKCQLFACRCAYKNVKHEIFSLFQYTSDELSIHVLQICFSVVPQLDDLAGDYPEIN
jgi:hypothetical protein